MPSYVLDGVSSGQVGVALRLGVGLDKAWEVGVGGATTFGAHVTDDWSSVGLTERYLGAYATFHLPVASTVELTPRLTVGALGLWRSTEPRRAGVVAADPAVTVSLAVLPALGIDWRPRVFGGVVGLTGAAELGCFPGAPRLHYERSGAAGAVPADRQVWILQPTFFLGLLVARS